MQQSGMRNLIFDINMVIDEIDDQDIWVVYSPEKELNQFNCLNDLLWRISFDAQKAVKNY